MLNYRYKLTKEIKDLLLELAIERAVFARLPKNEPRLTFLRDQAILKSSLFSARIEGNQISLEMVQSGQIKAKSKHKLELQNLERAYRWLNRRSTYIYDANFYCKLHGLAMANLTHDLGRFRTEITAIFDAAGQVVYLTPPPAEIKPRLVWIQKLTQKTSIKPEIKAALAHFAFEKIHPFVDGNGRVGRLLAMSILRQAKVDLGGLLSFEQAIEQHRGEYYEHLNINREDITNFVAFFLASLLAQAKTVAAELAEKKAPKSEPLFSLLPRRQEIYQIILDHQLVSFDFLHRRFLEVPVSTLHRDLKHLQEKGIVRKLGSTRGSVYQIIEK
jgi:Fic family protein